MTDAFGHWLAGFIDGEGCFTIVAGGRKRGSYVPSFTLALRRDDEPVLHEIVRETGLGRVYQVTSLKRDPPRYRSDWRISNKEQLLRLADLLTRYPLRAKKARDFTVWRDAVRLWGSVSLKRGSTPGHHPIQAQLAAMAEAIRDGRRFVPRRR